MRNITLYAYINVSSYQLSTKLRKIKINIFNLPQSIAESILKSKTLVLALILCHRIFRGRFVKMPRHLTMLTGFQLHF